MAVGSLTAAQCRVLGCLIEKEKATPQNYPLTLNALRLACNQTTNRHPIVEYDDATVEACVQLLREQGLTRNVYSTSNRSTKYRHVLGEVLGLTAEEEAVLAVLLLRGAQTVGEVKGRTDRLADFASIADVDEVLARLARRDEPLVQLLARQPGQKDPRWVHLLGGDDLAEEMAAVGSPAQAGAATGAGSAPGPLAAQARIDALEVELGELRAAHALLRAEFDAFRAEFG